MHVETPTLDDASLSESPSLNKAKQQCRGDRARCSDSLCSRQRTPSRAQLRASSARNNSYPIGVAPFLDDTWTLPVVIRGKRGSGTQNSGALSRGVSPRGDPSSPAWGQASAQLRSALLRSRNHRLASLPKPRRSGTSAPARPVTRAAARISWPVRRRCSSDLAPSAVGCASVTEGRPCLCGARPRAKRSALLVIDRSTTLRRCVRVPLSWRTSSAMSYESSSAPSEVTLPRFGLRIIPAMQPSAARGKTAECVANQQPDALQKQQRGV